MEVLTPAFKLSLLFINFILLNFLTDDDVVTFSDGQRKLKETSESSRPDSSKMTFTGTAPTIDTNLPTINIDKPLPKKLNLPAHTTIDKQGHLIVTGGQHRTYLGCEIPEGVTLKIESKKFMEPVGLYSPSLNLLSNLQFEKDTKGTLILKGSITPDDIDGTFILPGEGSITEISNANRGRAGNKG